MQESPELAFSTSSAVASNTVRTLLKQLCKHFSIAEWDCQLYCDGVPLLEEQKLSQVGCDSPNPILTSALRSLTLAAVLCSITGVLQVPGCSSGVIQLTAKIHPSVALYHWQLFHHASLCNPYSLADLWQAATEQYVRAYRDQEQWLSLKHTAAVTATTRMLLPLHCSPDTDRAAPTLPTALAPVRPLLQLTQVLLSQKTYDATHTKLTPSATASSTQTDSAQQDKSCKADPAKTTTEDYIALLQTALLTLKLISLLSAVSPQTSSTTAASTVLWASLAGTATTIAEAQSAQGQMSRPWNPPRPPEALSGTVVAVIKLLMSELRRGLVKDGMSSNASMCCRILAALLGLSLTKNAYCSEKTIADAITHPGSPCVVCTCPCLALHVVSML